MAAWYSTVGSTVMSVITDMEDITEMNKLTKRQGDKLLVRCNVKRRNEI